MITPDSHPHPNPPRNEATSLHIASARSGLPESISWIVSRFTPYLRIQARRRIQGILKDRYEEEDLVHEVWLRALPHLKDLRPRAGRWTPVLMTYLGTTLLRYANDLRRREIRRQMGNDTAAGPTPEPHQISANITNALSRALRNEASDAVLSALKGLNERERDTFTMRAMEGHSNAAIAEHFGESKQASSMRYARLLEKLRSTIHDGIVEELGFES